MPPDDPKPPPTFDLRALSPGTPEVLGSSASLGWPGIVLEKHRSGPGTRGAVQLDWNVVSLLRSRISRGAHGDGRGGMVPFTKTRGAITVLPAGLVPPLRLDTPSELLHCAVSPQLVQDFVDEIADRKHPGIVVLSGLQDPAVVDLLRLLEREVRADGVSGALYRDSLVRALLARLVSLAGATQDDPFSGRSPLPPRLLQRVFELIEAKLSGDLLVGDLAREAGYSRAHFLRRFRDATGRTPHQYLTERRVERAKWLLRSGDLPLIDVAAVSGFGSQPHLNATFARLVGQTPRQFRTRALSGKDRTIL